MLRKLKNIHLYPLPLLVLFITGLIIINWGRWDSWDANGFGLYFTHPIMQSDPIDMLGAMFIIEGLGASRARQWAAQLKTALKIDDEALTFLTYHGSNDDNHFDKLREVVSSGIITREIGEQLVKTAKVTARLYALQLEEIDNF